MILFMQGTKTMSETRNKLFDMLRAAKDGMQVAIEGAEKHLGPEIKRLGTQGNMELASGIFAGHGFVPYGPGQYTPSPEQQQQQLQQDRGLER
jgi:hypothetical protein